MTLETYLKNKAAPTRLAYREFCQQCRLAKAVCNCERLKAFETTTEFVILMHPEESRRRIATGRLTHLLLKSSKLLIAESFDGDSRVAQLLADPKRRCVVLYPGRAAVDLAEFSVETASVDERSPATHDPRRLTVFVLDGTWRTAKKMLRLTPALGAIEQIRFTPPRQSRFRIRKQPRGDYFSTLEAVHHLIGHFEPALTEREHMLELFDLLVERQIRYEREARRARGPAGRNALQLPE